MISDYGKILTGLIDNISGFRNLRPSASRNAHLMGLIAETVEVIHLLRTDVLEYVKNHNGLYIFGRTSTHIDAKDPRYSKWNWHKNGKIGGR